MNPGEGFDFSKMKSINLAEFMKRPDVSYNFEKPVRPYNAPRINYTSRTHLYASNEQNSGYSI